MDTIRIILADDHPLMRRGIRTMLHKAPDMEVVGEASNGYEVLSLVIQLQPDVLKLDMEMPGLNGIEVAKKLGAAGSDVAILALSAYEDKQYILGVLDNGASGYLSKEEMPDKILAAIRGVAQGEIGWVSDKLSNMLNIWLEEEVHQD